MKTQSIALPWVEQSFQSFEAGLNGEKEGAFHTIRQQACAVLKEKGLPSPKNESWKYTNVSSVSKLAPVIAQEVPAWDEKGYNFSDIPGALCTIQGVNGKVLTDLDVLNLPEGVSICSLQSLLKEQDSRSEAFSSLLDPAGYSLAALNASFMSDALVITVKAGVTVEAPLVWQWFTTAEGSSFPRLLVVLEDKADLTLIQTFRGAQDQSYLCAPVAEYIVGNEARCTTIVHQEESLKATHLSLAGVRQGDKSFFRSVHFNFGGSLVRNEIEPALDGEEIFTDLIGLNVLSGKQHVDNTTILDHKKPNSESNELYKGVYADSSTGVFNGTIIVRPDAQKTNAIQSNQSLLLSDSASSKARPQLKIWADDVRCTHGATVGQLEDEALFYLRSRGIGKEKARQMLIAAFVEEVVASIESESLQEFFTEKVDQRLDAILETL